VRDYFYRGPLAKRYCDAIEQAGGLMRASDLAAFRAEIDQPAKVNYRGYEIYKVGFWSQGPAMLETLNLLEGFDLKAMGHNSPDYVHTVTEAIKLAFADRDRYYGDPRFVKVPGAELLSKDYAEMRRALIDPKSASLEQRPGDPVNKKSDAAGNVFSATPSGAWLPSFIAGDTGIPISSRMQSFLLTPNHPNELKPGKRPRITLSPTLVLKGRGGAFRDRALRQFVRRSQIQSRKFERRKTLRRAVDRRDEAARPQGRSQRELQPDIGADNRHLRSEIESDSGRSRCAARALCDRVVAK
jgi:gamma-glutamyltranspeptidase/glutathione hydrolase